MTRDRSEPRSARVAGLALRRGPTLPMDEVRELRGSPEDGLEGDDRPAGKRDLTFLSHEVWGEVCREVGADLPWTTRRANVLIEGLELAALVGKRLRIGGIVVDVLGETAPCGRMEQARAGLEHALERSGRGGVHGRIVSGGTVQVGDDVAVVAGGV